MKKLLAILLTVFFVFSCQNDSKISISEKNRPLETWVFRSVLDQNPRMITAALDKDLFVSYYTNKGMLYKAWKGVVNFEGAVFDGAHGPQPTAVGDAYIINDESDTPWALEKNGDVIPHSYDYLGHKFVNGQVELMYRLNDKNGKSAKVNERIESGKTDAGNIIFDRSFTISDNDLDADVIWNGQAIVVDKSQISIPEDGQLSESKKIEFEAKTFESYDVRLKLKDNETVNFSYPLGAPTFLDPNIGDGFDLESDLPVGAIFIGKHDCKTCHNKSKKTIGPSYESIAKKYAHNDENVMMLASKIKKGGSGIWGDQVMTPHPEIGDYDLKEMISYIFTLADFEGEDSKVQEDLKLVSAVDIKEEDLLPGSITRAYNIPSTVKKMPKNLKDPIHAGVMPNFDNISNNDFQTLEENFALVSIGYFHAPKEGFYDFRLWSDDGSLLYIHDKLVIDHDGHHGTSMKQTRINLAEGYHPFKIEFFQGAGGKFLSWNYKPDGTDMWRVIPTERISHNKADKELMGSLSLPMSVVAKLPGDGYPVMGVHPSFDLEQARPDDFEPKVAGLDFLADGRTIVSLWNEEGGVYIIEGEGTAMKAKKIAEGLAEPLGLKVVGDRIFVMQKQEMTELIDTNGDDIIDEYRTICDDWGVSNNFHEFGFGMVHKDGHLYANLATGIMPGGAGMKNQHPDRGSTIKVNIEDGSYERFANGMRTPNGIGIGFGDEIFVADNEGDWLPSSKIIHVEKGDWFGSRAVDFEGTANFKEKLPVVWLPQNEIGNSPSTPQSINVGPYKNQMIHGEVTNGGIKRVFVEEVNGALQGCLFRFIQGLEAGVNRIAWGPDGALYAGGIGNPGNWQHSGQKWFGLQKLTYNEKSAFEMLAVRAKTDGIEIEFTEPLKEGDGWQKSDYEIKQWYYKPTADYGGPKLDESKLNIRSVNVSDDRKKVFLELDGMKENHVVYVHLQNNFISAQDHSLWSTEAWYTMNQIPQNQKGFKSATIALIAANSLSESEKKDGWQLLFDGKDIGKHLHTFNTDAVDKKWIIEGDAIAFDSTKDGKGGDLVTNESYENYELNLEWKISACGNSGIMFNVQEGEDYWSTYMTGPEMQILDNTCHPDTKFVTHRAGDLYDMIECKYSTVNPAGVWNKVRLISNNGDVQFWLNGYEVVSFTMHNEAWIEMVANSKFNEWKEFGTHKSGHIAFQDHADKVWFRNLKIKRL